MILPTSHTITKVWYSGIHSHPPARFSPTGLSPSMAGHSSPLRLTELGCRMKPNNLTSPPYYLGRIRFELSPFRSPLLRGSLLVSLPPPTKMFPFGGFPLLGFTPGAMPPTIREWHQDTHSEIQGSTTACVYPWHIAACRVLPRLPSRAIHQGASS